MKDIAKMPLGQLICPHQQYLHLEVFGNFTFVPSEQFTSNVGNFTAAIAAICIDKEKKKKKSYTRKNNKINVTHLQIVVQSSYFFEKKKKGLACGSHCLQKLHDSLLVKSQQSPTNCTIPAGGCSIIQSLYSYNKMHRLQAFQEHYNSSVISMVEVTQITTNRIQLLFGLKVKRKLYLTI